MAENLYAMIHTHETASPDAKQFGVEVAVVTSVDPSEDNNAEAWTKAGNAVKVKLVRLPDGPELNWCRVVQPAGGAGRGFYWVPHIGDEVLIAFERGEANRPYVIGSLWNGKDKPMKDAFTKDNSKVMIQTKSGHCITFDDKKDAEKIIIADKSGKRSIAFDVKAKKFIIDAQEGDVEIHAEKGKILLNCEDLEIKTKQSGKIDIGSTFDLNITKEGNIKAVGNLNIKASRVNIN